MERRDHRVVSKSVWILGDCLWNSLASSIVATYYHRQMRPACAYLHSGRVMSLARRMEKNSPI